MKTDKFIPKVLRYFNLYTAFCIRYFGKFEWKLSFVVKLVRASFKEETLEVGRRPLNVSLLFLSFNGVIKRHRFFK